MKIIILLILNIALWANIGTVAAFRGTASISRDGESLNVVSGMNIERHDQVLTKEKTRMQVILKDNTVVTIGSNSSFGFLEFSMQEGKERVSMKADGGFFRSVTGAIGKVAPERFKVHTVSATIGIRGTDFSAFIKPNLEIIKCYKGIIRVDFKRGVRDIAAGRLIEIRPHTDKVKVFKPVVKQSLPAAAPTEKLKKKSFEVEDIPETNRVIEHSELTEESTLPEETYPPQGEEPPQEEEPPFTITPGTEDRPTEY